MLAALPLLAALSAPALAQDAVVRGVKGSVSLRPFGQERSIGAASGDALIFGDGVTTGPQSAAQIVLPSGGVILLGENTTFILDGDPDNVLATVSVGEFLIGLKRKRGLGQSFRTSTPGAVAAADGSLFWGRVDADKTSLFAGFAKEVAVTAAGKTVTINAGERVTVAYGKPPATPKPHSIPREYLAVFTIDGSLQGLDALVDGKAIR